MPKTLRITTFVLATLVLVWLLLTLVRTQLPVTVTIENGGPTAIQSVQVVHEHGVIRCREIPVGKSRKARFYTTGETSYKLTVVFMDGSMVTGGGNYAEPGYAFREYVRGRHITNELERLPPF